MKQSAKEYADLYRRNKALFRRVREAILFIASDPSSGKPLRFGLKGSRAYRVGMFRIIYCVEHKILAIHILKIDHRKDVYG